MFPVRAFDDMSTLGDIVLEQPRAAALFERLGLDYCCGGRLTLHEACGHRGLHAVTVATLLRALADEPADHELDVHDVARASLSELCDHIVVGHHEPLRRELPRINNVLGTVVRVHASTHPELHDLQRLFVGVRSELEAHMRTEEEALFPSCRALDGDGTFDAGLLDLLEHDHAATGDALCALRELAGGYDTEAALCGTHRSLLRALRAFELDMHQHVHEENNVLFPRVRALIAT
jgi:regulator of cell morphogenesis and NO signaling